MFVSPVHSFMDIDGAYTVVNLLQITVVAIIPFAVTQFIGVIRESIKK